jgi:hypothetical protein
MLEIRLSLLILLFSMTATFSAPQQQTEAAPKVLELENKWNEAYKQGDTATLNSLLADDFIITVEEGATFSKAGYEARKPEERIFRFFFVICSGWERDA